MLSYVINWLKPIATPPHRLRNGTPWAVLTSIMIALFVGIGSVQAEDRVIPAGSITTNVMDDGFTPTAVVTLSADQNLINNGEITNIRPKGDSGTPQRDGVGVLSTNGTATITNNGQINIKGFQRIPDDLQSENPVVGGTASGIRSSGDNATILNDKGDWF